MKKYLIPALALALLVSATGASKALADAYTYHVNWQDGMDSPGTFDVDPAPLGTSILGNDYTDHQPEFYSTDSVELVFNDATKHFGIGTIDEAKITNLSSDLSTINSTLSSLSSIPSTVSANSASIGTLNAFKTAYASSSPVSYYLNNVATTSPMKRLLFNGTTTGGVTTFYLTNDGTSSGTALCPIGIDQVNVVANDPNNTLGIGWAMTNSNKTMTVTANARSFTTTTILGISVLGSSALAAAANGTAIMASVDCN